MPAGPMHPGAGPTYDPDIGRGEWYELRPAGDRLYSMASDMRVIGWRVECFEAKGFDHVDALALALRRDVDRVEVERLVDDGATHRQVMDLVL